MSAIPDPAAFDTSEVASRFARLGTVTPFADVKQGRADMVTDAMVEIVDQAVTLVSEYYVHLPLKRNLYAADPLRQLRILRNRITARPSDPMAEDDFHREMIAIFVSLRDLHTSYTLPEPYRHRIAFLPFLVESSVSDGGSRPRFLVTKTYDDEPFSDPDFGAGDPDDERTHVRVTHWNAIPIERAIELNGARSGGSNDAARRARGLDRLTFRWLGRLPVPDEEWVVVTYEVADQTRHLSFPWLVVERPGLAAQPSGRSGSALTLGLDREGEWIRSTKRELFDRTARAGNAPLYPRTDDLRGAFAYSTRSHPTDGRIFGYLRLYSFDLEGHPGLLREIRAALRHRVGDDDRPVDGLIVDIRGNPGGDVPLAERVLQALSPVPIVSEVVEFINTPRSLKLAQALHPRSNRFVGYVEEALATGSQYIRGLEFDPEKSRYPVDQAYQGPVVLIVDALSYSAADVFAAGFQDHDLGQIIGTDPQTGGGGGNIWEYQLVRQFDRLLPKKLPHNTSFDVAVRRTRRVERGGGVTLEDRGVVVPLRRTTPLGAADVLGRNKSLIEAAMSEFAHPERQPRWLRCRYSHATRRFTLHAQGLARVDAFIDDHPVGSVAEPDGKHVQVPDGAPHPTTARFQGYVSPFERPAIRVSLAWRARAG